MSRAPWKILHIRLDEGIKALDAPEGYHALLLIFWWQGVPLGQAEVPIGQLPMSEIQVANLALRAITPVVHRHLQGDGGAPGITRMAGNEKPLWLLQERWRKQRANAPALTVSVVVCTYNRPQQLANCLRSLQQLSPQPHEILVVDNAPASGETRLLVDQVAGARYVAEPRLGLSAARNTGIRASTGEIVAFTDDDVLVDPGWIGWLQEGFRNSQVMSVTGLVLPAELETEAQLVFERGFGGFGQGYRPLRFDSRFFARLKPRGVPVWRIGAGANMALRRSAFDQVGVFDERLGAGAAGCSEDSELWYRLLARGWVCRYEPRAVVHHVHRRDFEGLKRQMYLYMRGHVAALLVQFLRHRHWGNLRRLLLILPAFYGKQVGRILLRSAKHRERILLAELLGSLSGIGFFLSRSLGPGLKQRLQPR